MATRTLALPKISGHYGNKSEGLRLAEPRPLAKENEREKLIRSSFRGLVKNLILADYYAIGAVAAELSSEGPGLRGHDQEANHPLAA